MEPPHQEASGRQLRPRPSTRNYEDRHTLDWLEADSAKRLDVQGLRRRLEGDPQVAEFSGDTHPGYLAGRMLHVTGFRSPIVVRGSSSGQSVEETRQALGLLLPLQYLSPAGLAAAVGSEHQVPVIDVETQRSGPRMALGQLAQYFAAPPQQRARLLNVVSCSLAGTPLEGQIIPPAATRSLDLVAQVWPPGEEPHPETLVYALIGPQGAYTDWHVDMGGSAVWYHMITGEKVFVLAPPTEANLSAFEDWSSSSDQHTTWLGERLEGCQRVRLGAGDTLLLPSGWPHAVSTPQDSMVVGGNFLHSLDYGAIADAARREQRLGVLPKFQFPLFRALMWHAARDALARMQQGSGDAVSMVISRWEVEGLPALLSLLREFLGAGAGGHKGRPAASTGVPEAYIPDPHALLSELERQLGDVAGALVPLAGPAPAAQPEASLQQQPLDMPPPEATAPHPLLATLPHDGMGWAAQPVSQGARSPATAAAGAAGQAAAGAAAPLYGDASWALPAPLATPVLRVGVGEVWSGPGNDALALPEGTVSPLLGVEGLDGRGGRALGGPGPQNGLGQDGLGQESGSQDALADDELAELGSGFEDLEGPGPSFLDSMSLMLLAGAGAQHPEPAGLAVTDLQAYQDEAADYAMRAVLGLEAGAGQGTTAAEASATAAAVMATVMSPVQPRPHELPPLAAVGGPLGGASAPLVMVPVGELLGQHQLAGATGHSWEDEGSDEGEDSEGGARQRRSQDLPPRKKGLDVRQAALAKLHRMRAAGPGIWPPASANGSAAAAKAAADSSGDESDLSIGDEEGSSDSDGADLAWEPGMPLQPGQRKPSGSSAGARVAKKAARRGGEQASLGTADGVDGAARGRLSPADRQRSGAGVQGGGRTGGMGAGTGARKGRKGRGELGGEEGRPTSSAARMPLPSPAPKDLQALGRKTPLGYVPSLGRSKAAAATPAATAAAAGTAPVPAQPGVPRHAPAAGASRDPRRAASGAAAAAAAAQPSSGRAPSPSSSAAADAAAAAARARTALLHRLGDRKQREAAEKLLEQVAQLEAALRKERELLDKVGAGLVPVRDGGARIRASIADKERQLRVKRAFAVGQVFTYADEKGISQGPFTSSQLKSLLRAGVLFESSHVHHPRHGTLSLRSALELPEPLSALIQRERAQQVQQAQQMEQQKEEQRRPGKHDAKGQGQGQQQAMASAGAGLKRMFWEVPREAEAKAKEGRREQEQGDTQQQPPAVAQQQRRGPGEQQRGAGRPSLGTRQPRGMGEGRRREDERQREEWRRQEERRPWVGGRREEREGGRRDGRERSEGRKEDRDRDRSSRPPKRQRWEQDGERGRGRGWEGPNRPWEAEAAQQAAQEDEEGGWWSFANEEGETEGPYNVGELRRLFKEGVLKTDVLVHDEEEGVSMRLFTLLGYSAALGGLQPALPPPPRMPQQQQPQPQLKQPSREGPPLPPAAAGPTTAAVAAVAAQAAAAARAAGAPESEGLRGGLGEGVLPPPPPPPPPGSLPLPPPSDLLHDFDYEPPEPWSEDENADAGALASKDEALLAPPAVVPASQDAGDEMDVDMDTDEVGAAVVRPVPAASEPPPAVTASAAAAARVPAVLPLAPQPPAQHAQHAPPWQEVQGAAQQGMTAGQGSGGGGSWGPGGPAVGVQRMPLPDQESLWESREQAWVEENPGSPSRVGEGEEAALGIVPILGATDATCQVRPWAPVSVAGLEGEGKGARRGEEAGGGPEAAGVEGAAPEAGAAVVAWPLPMQQASMLPTAAAAAPMLPALPVAAPQLPAAEQVVPAQKQQPREQMQQQEEEEEEEQQQQQQPAAPMRKPIPMTRDVRSLRTYPQLPLAPISTSQALPGAAVPAAGMPSLLGDQQQQPLTPTSAIPTPILAGAATMASGAGMVPGPLLQQQPPLSPKGQPLPQLAHVAQGATALQHQPQPQQPALATDGLVLQALGTPEAEAPASLSFAPVGGVSAPTAQPQQQLQQQGLQVQQAQQPGAQQGQQGGVGAAASEADKAAAAAGAAAANVLLKHFFFMQQTAPEQPAVASELVQGGIGSQLAQSQAVAGAAPAGMQQADSMLLPQAALRPELQAQSSAGGMSTAVSVGLQLAGQAQHQQHGTLAQQGVMQVHMQHAGFATATAVAGGTAPGLHFMAPPSHSQQTPHLLPAQQGMELQQQGGSGGFGSQWAHSGMPTAAPAFQAAAVHGPPLGMAAQVQYAPVSGGHVVQAGGAVQPGGMPGILLPGGQVFVQQPLQFMGGGYVAQQAPQQQSQMIYMLPPQ